MKKSKRTKAISLLMAMVMIVSMLPLQLLTLNLATLNTNAAASPLTQKEFLIQACKVLGAPYSSSVPGTNYMSSATTPYSASQVLSSGLDCTGLLWWTLSSLGVSIDWGSKDHYPVPYDFNRWNALCYSGGTITYNGTTVSLNMGRKTNENASDWWVGVPEGSAVVCKYSDGNHGGYYIGEFSSKKELTDYLSKNYGLTIADSNIVSLGNGTHWVIESTTGHGSTSLNRVVISNPDKMTKSAASTCETIWFQITTVQNDTYQYYVKKTDADGKALSGTTFGVYTNAGCTNRITNITTDGSGIAKYDSGTENYDALYAKELSGPANYDVNSTSILMTKATNSTTVPNNVATIVDTSLGNLKIKKVSGDTDKYNTLRPANGWKFKVVGTCGSTTVYTENVTTGTDGTVTITGLRRNYIKNNANQGKITYTITETGLAADYYYDSTTSKTTTLSNPGSTVTVEYANKLKRGTLVVNKNSTDGVLSGFQFKLTGTSDYGDAVNETATTNASGVATFSNIPIGSNYKVEEINTPTKYVIPNPHTGLEIKWNETNTQYFYNTLKTFKIILHKTDEDTITPIGDATLEGAVYGIYKGGQLVKTYTTDVNGDFTTDYMVCGDDYTVREITPPEGYQLNSTVYNVDAKATNFTVEKNTVIVDTTDKIITSSEGAITIIKTCPEDFIGGVFPAEEYAEFEVYLSSNGSYNNSADSVRDKLITNENGIAESKALPYGTYTVHQTRGITGYDLVPDFQVAITENNQKPVIKITGDTPLNSYVKIQKFDSTTNKIIPIAGVGFKIYKADGTLIQQEVTYPSSEVIDTFYTNADGYLKTPQPLGYGDYYIVEQNAPEGYVLDETKVEFTIDLDNAERVTINNVDSYVTTVTKNNIPQKGTITVEKKGEVLSTIQKLGDTYRPVYAVKGLENAVYEVTAKTDIYTPDGTKRYSAGQVVATLTTDETGKATTGQLFLGKYVVTEKTAPYGMVLNTTPNNVELKYAGETVKVTNTQTSFVNNRQKVDIKVLKTMEEDEIFDIGDNTEIQNVTFGLYAQNEIVALDGTKIPANGLIEVLSIDQNGLGETSVDLPLGKYYFKEIETDEHYILNTNKYTVTFTYADQTVDTVELTANNSIPIENVLKRGTIQGTKLDEDGTPVQGVLFGLFKPGETTFTEATAYLTSLTDTNGKFIFEDVPYGEYVVREISTTEEFNLQEKTEDAEIVNDGDVYTTPDIINYYIRGNVELVKYDDEFRTDDYKLSGATYSVYRDENENGKYDNGEEKIGQLVDLGNGTYTSVGMTSSSIYYNKNAETGYTGLRYGHYVIVETNPKTGYLINNSSYPFFINVDEETERIPDFVTDTVIRGWITISKYDAEFKDMTIPGAEFTLYDDTNTNGTYEAGIDVKVGTFRDVGDGTYDLMGLENSKYFNSTLGLRYGHYLVKETVAPEGYIQDEIYDAVFIDTHGKNYVIYRNDSEHLKYFEEPIRGDITVTKFDSQFTTEKIKGSVYGLYKDVNKDGIYQEDIDTFVDYLTAQGDGTYKIEDIRYGKYIVREISAPENYLCSYDAYGVYYPVFIKENEKNYPVNDSQEVKRGNITLTKVDAEFQTDKIDDAVFGLYIDYDNDGKFNTDTDIRVGTLVSVSGKPGIYTTLGMTDANERYYGMNTTTNYMGIRYGKYFIVEEDPTTPYNPDTNNGHLVSITENARTVAVVRDSDSYFLQYVIRGNVEFVKIDADPEYLTPVSGATYELYRDINENGKYDETDILVGTLKDNGGTYTSLEMTLTTGDGAKYYGTNTDPNTTPYTGLRYGKYIIIEKDPSTGFVLDTDKNGYAFEVLENEKDYTITRDLDEGEFAEYVIRGNVEFIKIDADPEYLTKVTDAEYELYADTNGDGIGDVLVGTLKDTNKDGKYTSLEMVLAENGAKYFGTNTDPDQTTPYTGLRFGKYVIKETKPGTGFVLDTNLYTFNVTENEKMYNITRDLDTGKYAEYIIRGNVEFTKIDADPEYLNVVTDAEYKLYRDVNENGKYDEGTDILVGTLTDTNKDGKYTSLEMTLAENGAKYFGTNTDPNQTEQLVGLRFGKYVIVETKPGEGFILDSNRDGYAFNIDVNGEVEKITRDLETGKYAEYIKRGEVTFTKIDADPEYLTTVDGATYKIYRDVNENGKYDADTDVLVGTLVNTGNGVYTTNGMTGANAKYYGTNTDPDQTTPYTGLRFGKYVIIEVDPSTGFINDLDSNGYAVNVTENEQKLTITRDLETGKFAEYIKRGEVTFTKIDADPEYLTTVDGATYKIYRDINENGKYDADTDVLVGTLVNTGNGVYTTNGMTGANAKYYGTNTDPDQAKLYTGLRFGKYVIVEVDPSTGFVLDTNRNGYAIDVTENEQKLTILRDLEDSKFAEYIIRGNVEFTKIDADPEYLNVVTDAEYKLYRDVNENGKYDADTDILVGTLTDTNKDGKYTSLEMTLAENGAKYFGTNTDPNQTEQLVGLRFGKYVIVETKPGEGFILDSNRDGYAFNIDVNGEVEKITRDLDTGKYAEYIIRGNVEFTKIDADPEYLTKVTDAEYELYADTNGDGIGDVLVGTLKDTNKDGKYTSLEMVLAENGAKYFGTNTDPDQTTPYIGLRFGKYVIKETKPGTGFVLDTNLYTFNVTENEKMYNITRDLDTGKYAEYIIRGNVEFTKIDADPEYLNVVTDAEYKLYRDVNENGKYDEGTDILVGTLTDTNKDGKYTSLEMTLAENGAKYFGTNTDPNQTEQLVGLRFGKYVIVETKPGEGFILDSNRDGYAFNIDVNGEVEKITRDLETGKYAEYIIRGNIELIKVDSEFTDETIEGATYELYADTNNNGELDAEDELIGELLDAGDGKYTSLDMSTSSILYGENSDSKYVGLRYGRYFVKETEATEGYICDENVYTIFIDTNEKTYIIERDNTDGLYYEYVIRGTVVVTKEDDEFNEDKLTGTVFEIYRDVDTTDDEFDEENDILVGRLYDNGDGTYTLENIENGKYINNELGGLRYGGYYIKEATPPEGYLVNDEIQYFFIDEDGMEAAITYQDTVIRGLVELLKVDAEYPDKVIENANYAIYRDVNNNGKYEEDIDEYIGRLADVGEGRYDLSALENGKYYNDELGGLRYGRYLVKEMAPAPEGFLVDAKYYPIYIEEDGHIYLVANNETTKEEDGTFLEEPIRGDLKIIKTDENGNPLEGVGFRVYDKDGNVIAEVYTDKDGIALFEDLRYGEYSYQEFKGLEGYTFDDSKVSFTIEENEKVIEAKVTNKSIPKTLDETPIATMALFGIFALAGLSIIIKKRREEIAE